MAAEDFLLNMLYIAVMNIVATYCSQINDVKQSFVSG